MADFVVKNPPEYNPAMRKLETTDPDHADVFNELFGQLINNDAFLEALARATANSLVGHTGDGAIHVTAQDKHGWDAKAGTETATQGKAGLMAAADKKKLDGVAEGAEANQNAYSNIRVGSVTVTANGKTATLTLEAGENVTLTADNAAKRITIKANRDGGDADTVDGYHASSFATSTQVDELKKSVSDGKKSVAAAVTAKGVTTAADAAFATIVANIGRITTGVDTSDATAAAADILSPKTAYVNGSKITGTVTDAGDTLSLQAGGTPENGIISAGWIQPNTKYARVRGNTTNFKISGAALAIGLTADKILRGNTILGIAGTGSSGGKDITVTGDITSGTASINLADYGIGDDWHILYAENVSRTYYHGPAVSPGGTSSGTTVTQNGYTCYDVILYVFVDNTHVACFHRDGGGMGTNFPYLGFRNFTAALNYCLMYRGCIDSRPTNLGVGRYFSDSLGAYKPSTNHLEYTTRIIAV